MKAADAAQQVTRTARQVWMFYFQFSASKEGSTWIDTALVLSSTLFSLLGSVKFIYVLIFSEVPSEVSRKRGPPRPVLGRKPTVCSGENRPGFLAKIGRFLGGNPADSPPLKK